MPDQRYVSDELTHFVGRGLAEEAQYALLVDVLRSGLLARVILPESYAARFRKEFPDYGAGDLLGAVTT